MAQGAPAVKKRLRFLHETLFSVNVAYAVALVTTFLLERRSMLYGARGSPDFFGQVLLRINFFFYHQPVFTPLGTDVVLTGFTLIYLVLSLMVLHLLARVHMVDATLRLPAGVTALAAVPVSWTSYRPTYTGLWLLCLYFAFIGGALFLTRRRPSPAWFIVLAVHYSVCGYAILHTSAPGFFDWPRYHLDLPSMWPYLLSLVSPSAGLLWALYVLRPSAQPRAQLN